MALDAFWTWALVHWRNPAVESQLLALQEHHNIVVLEVLWLAWLGRCGHRVTHEQREQLADAAAPWVVGVIVPMRQQRQVWREQPGADDLRQRLKGLEVSAERELAEIYASHMAERLPDLDTGAPDDAVAMLANLEVALAAGDPSPPPDISSRLGALLAVA